MECNNCGVLLKEDEYFLCDRCSDQNAWYDDWDYPEPEPEREPMQDLIDLVEECSDGD